MNLTIDGRSVAAKENETVLQCALRHGISIPHLCTHPCLPPFGACRMCVVEIDGIRGYPTSCTTPTQAGMVVRTDTAALQKLRRNILELILLEHPSACLVCAKQDLCERYRPKATKAGRTTGCHTCNNKEACEVRTLSEQLNLASLPASPIYRDLPLERSDPFMDRDLNLCILCGRCVRICKAHQGEAVIDFVGRGSRCRIGEAFGRSLKQAGCRFCGSCVDVCPTGSIADRFVKWHGAPATVTETTCLLCDAGCALKVHANAVGRVVSARGLRDTHPICVLGRFAVPELLNGLARLTVPKVRFDSVLKELPWEETLKLAAERLAPHVGEGFAFVCDTTSTLEDRHVFRRFTQQVMRSSHYMEITPDALGVARASIPDGVKSLFLTGSFIEPSRLGDLALLIVQDCYPSPASERADFILPAAVFTEVDGTIVDGGGAMRPLLKGGRAAGAAQPEWKIVSNLAQALCAKDFNYRSTADLTREVGATLSRLRTETSQAPPAALDPALRRAYFRGHLLEEHVRGLREIGAPVAKRAASGE